MNNMIVRPLTLLCISLLSSVSSQTEYHLCEGTTTQAAGLSGTVKVTGNCQLNLTGITGRISFLSVRPCEEAPQLQISGVSYCHDASSTDSYIDVSGDEIALTAGEVDPFIMEYYHGKHDR